MFLRCLLKVTLRASQREDALKHTEAEMFLHCKCFFFPLVGCSVRFAGMGSVRVTVAESKTASKTIELKQRGDYKKTFKFFAVASSSDLQNSFPLLSLLCVCTRVSLAGLFWKISGE